MVNKAGHSQSVPAAVVGAGDRVCLAPPGSTAFSGLGLSFSIEKDQVTIGWFVVELER
jgi:hypothetical protein